MALKCDFCSSPNIKWAYPCRDFTIPENLAGSHGSFAACDECKALVESDNREALLNRSVNTIPFFKQGHIPTGLKRLLKEEIRRIHNSFFANRLGPVRTFYPD